MTLARRVDELRKKYPAWLIGECWAWRKLTRPQWRAGCAGYITAEDFAALEQLLQEQEDLAETLSTQAVPQ